jgi:hypothetical protein
MMKRKKVYKNDARPRINPLAYLSNDGKKKKFTSLELGYLTCPHGQRLSGKRFRTMTHGQG